MMKRSEVLHAIHVARSESAQQVDAFYDAALVERTLMFFQELLVKISRRSYFLHPEFLPGIEIGYDAFLDEFEDDASLTLVQMLNAIESSLSRARNENAILLSRVTALPEFEYQYHVGFVVGWCAAMIESGAAPVLPVVVSRYLAPVLADLIMSIVELLGFATSPLRHDERVCFALVALAS